MRSPEEHAVASTIIALMRGTIYQSTDEGVWANLDRYGAAVRDHFSRVGLTVVTDDTEGYAYLRAQEPVEGEEPLPPLVRRRALTYNVSLLLILLRKRMLEFDAMEGEGKLVVSRDQMIDMLLVFQPSNDNEVKVIKGVDATINKVLELGFLRALRGQTGLWEVPRILKAYVDAEALGDLEQKLDSYRLKDADD